MASKEEEMHSMVQGQIQNFEEEGPKGALHLFGNLIWHLSILSSLTFE